MASRDRINVDVEVKSNADKMWESLKDSAVLFPKALPDLYKSIQVLEGDGKSVGSVHFKNFRGLPLTTVLKEKIDSIDEDNKTLCYSIIEVEESSYYKNFKAQVKVVEKGEGSLVKWECEFEKASEVAADHHPALYYKDFAVKNFKQLDDYLLKA
ncbi:MLP-like protein 423 [Malania oleifera]|uniref:MLP-like protein 423 n=1 Tax=Malania oleifera TaxID=397392 RepID=UPI0025AE7BEC|nr:MLP-like protein 423 isoform X1 [Malania oleifera]XP_057949252.1 MLP-like protein 423 [Malania oleifera]